jgi:hypothetical protein
LQLNGERERSGGVSILKMCLHLQRGIKHNYNYHAHELELNSDTIYHSERTLLLTIYRVFSWPNFRENWSFMPNLSRFNLPIKMLPSSSLPLVTASPPVEFLMAKTLMMLDEGSSQDMYSVFELASVKHQML